MTIATTVPGAGDPYAAMVDAIETEQGLPTGTLRALYETENFRTSRKGAADAVSPRGATGVMQVMPATFDALKRQGLLPPEADIKNPEHNIRAAAVAFKGMLRETQGDVIRAAAYYNGGNFDADMQEKTKGWPKRWMRLGTPYEDTLPQETRNYVPRYSAILRQLTGAPAGGNVDTVKAQIPAGGSFDPLTLEALTMDSMQQAVQLNNSSEDLRKFLQETGVRRNAAVDASTKAAVAGATAKGEALVMDAERVARMNADNQMLATALGISQEDLVAASAKIGAIRDKRMAIADDINSRKAVGLFDNPFQWLVNQLALPGLIGEHNMYAQQERSNMRALNVQSALTNEAWQLRAATTQDVGRDAAVKRAAAEVGEATSKAEELKARNFGAQAQDALTQQQLQQKEFENSRVAITDRQHQLQETRAAQSFDITKRIHEEQLAEKQRKETDAAEVESRAKQVGAVLGQDFSVKVLDKEAKWLREEIMAGANNGRLGSNVVGALKVFEAKRNPEAMLRAGSAGLLEFGKQLKAEALREQDKATRPDATGRKPNAQEVLARVDDALKTKYEERYRNTALDGKENPYAAQHEVLAVMPELQRNIVATTVQQILKGGVKPELLADGAVLDQVILKAAEAKMNPEDLAVHVHAYYKHAMALNQKTRPVQLFGLPVQLQYNYLGTTDNGTLFGGKRIAYDFEDVNQVRKFIVAQRALQIRQQTATFLGM